MKIITVVGARPQFIKAAAFGYLEMIWLIKYSIAVITDSVGLQKEAYFFKKPCITMRDETEWVELVEAGANHLSGADESSIIHHVGKALNTDQSVFDHLLYGSGDASSQIIYHLAKHCNT